MATAAATKQAVPGDNALALITDDQLAKDFAHVDAALKELEEKAAAIPSVFEDDDDLNLAKEIAPKLRGAAKRCDQLREQTKAPYLAAGNTVQTWFKKQEKRMADWLSAHEKSATNYLNKKAAKAAEEQRQIEAAQRAEAARLASEAAQQAAAGKLQEAVQTQAAANTATQQAERAAEMVDARPAERARTTTEAGTSTLVENYGYRIVDRTKIDGFKLISYATDKELNDIVARAVKQGVRELSGIEIFPDHKARL